MFETNKLKITKKLTTANFKKGFTIIELLVVMAMMVVMVGLFTVNLAGQRAGRDMRIAQSELVTNLRKIQSYTLSGRKVGTTQPAKYYVGKFDTSSAAASGYTLQVMYKDEVGIWKLNNVETVKFPAGVTLSGIRIVKADGTTTINSACALVAFQVPFARIYMNDGCSPSAPSYPYTIADGDDYKKIINFITNAGGLTTMQDAKITLTFTYGQDSAAAKTVEINGITGSISFQ